MNINTTELELTVEAIEALAVAVAAKSQHATLANVKRYDQDILDARGEVKERLRELLLAA